jgi:uroporphyrinogen decarboxylase
MTSRERIQKLLRREPVDHIPNGLGGTETAGLHVLTYQRLKNILGVTDPTTRIGTFMTNAIFEPSVLAALEGDIILLDSGMCPSRLWGEGTAGEWKDLHIWDTTVQVCNAWQFRQDAEGAWGWNDGAKCPPGGFYFDGVPTPPSERKPVEDPVQPLPDDYHPRMEFRQETLRLLEAQAKFLYETTDFSICCGEMIHDLAWEPGGSVAWMMRMIEEPEACHAYLNKFVDAALAQLKQLDQAVGKYCDILAIAHDLGDRRGVTMGPDLWRRIYKPHYKRLFTEWKKITRMKSYLHSCGAISDIIGDLIECGLDIINPIQLSGRGMEPESLQERFGGRIIFYGGAHDAVLCPPGTPDEMVYEACKKNISALSRNGGYILAGVHNLPADTPASHLQAMLQAWRDVREDPALTIPKK